MKVENVITLDNNVNCLLLDKANYNDTNYYLALILDEKEEPTEDSVVLKETIENGDIYVEREDNEEVLQELLKLFTKSFNKMVANLPEEID